MALLEVSNLAKAYKTKQALNQVSFSIDKGEIVALIGKNGAGKTTLLNCISYHIKPDGGSVLYKGKDLLSQDSLLNEFGILIQASFFDYLNASDNLKLLMKASGITDKKQIDKIVNETLDLVGLSEKKKKYVKTFSFGMKQRLGLAQTLLHQPKFLILDEPFVGLDPIGKEMLKKVIQKKAKEEQAGILFSSHDLFDVGEICDRIIMIEDGTKIFDDVFQYKKTYSIFCSQEITKELERELKEMSERITIIKNEIQLMETVQLKRVLSVLIGRQIEIIDISIKENSLYDYFRTEAAQ